MGWYKTEMYMYIKESGWSNKILHQFVHAKITLVVCKYFNGGKTQTNLFTDGLTFATLYVLQHM